MFLNNLLMICEELLEGKCSFEHSAVENIDANLDCLLLAGPLNGRIQLADDLLVFNLHLCDFLHSY